MISLTIFLIFALSVLGVGFLAALSDIRSLKIPNIYSALILAAFPVCFSLMWLLGATDIFLPWWSHIGAMAIIFVISAALFFMKIMGAADSKLATAFALWIGLGNLPIFLFVMTLFGAFLGAFALFVSKKKPFENPKEGGWIAQLQSDQNKVPYGVAISLGAVFGFYHVGYLNLEVLAAAFGI